MFATFARKFLYGAVGSTAAALLAGAHALGATVVPPADALAYATQTVVIGAFTGLAGVLKRLFKGPR